MQAALSADIEVPDFVATGADYLVKDVMMGAVEEQMPYISQAEYQKKINEGLSPEEIWPQLTHPKHITQRDRLSAELDLGLMREDGKLRLNPAKFLLKTSQLGDPSGRTRALSNIAGYGNDYGVKAKSKIYDRNEWYAAGGEIDEKGIW